MPRFNNVELAEETMKRTRQHFADNAQACIDAVVDSTVKLPSHTCPIGYIAWREQDALDSLAGLRESNFTFLQRAYWLQTGEMVALLP